jgi:hydrogenase-4 transcriptional activator
MLDRKPDEQTTLLQIWRETCCHIDLSESIEIAAGIAAAALPLAGLVIRRLDPQSNAIDTIAIGLMKPEQAEAWRSKLESRSALPEARFRLAQRWAATGEASYLRPGEVETPAHVVVPARLKGNLVVGPLLSDETPTGFLIGVCTPGTEFSVEDLALFQQLLEPFSVALENDRRMHEMAALREAAEADRRTLLKRLGRQDLTEAIVGADTGLRSVMERVNLVSHSDVPVLILGETGTGKEVVARSIHSRSARSSGPFIRVNCGAIPAELIDSQLFGHEKGSFTGALDSRKGWFERADGGTLFLDEMGELPLPAQVRLLRVLQDGFIERVGGQHSLRVDVRIVTATHRDLQSMVKQGEFREDLWYRINVFPILLPRLRERSEDIPALVEHFAHKAAMRFGLPFVSPSYDDLALLRDYPWPGNIRELGAVIDRAVILGNGIRLEVAKALGISSQMRNSTPIDEPTFYEVIPESPEGVQPHLQTPPRASQICRLDEAMRRHIQNALGATKGKIEGEKGAAKLLGINPHTLRARMRKLKIAWAEFRRDA